MEGAPGGLWEGVRESEAENRPWGKVVHCSPRCVENCRWKGECFTPRPNPALLSGVTCDSASSVYLALEYNIAVFHDNCPCTVRIACLHESVFSERWAKCTCLHEICLSTFSVMNWPSSKTAPKDGVLVKQFNTNTFNETKADLI